MLVMDAAANWSAIFAGVAVLISVLGLLVSGWNASRWSKASKRADAAEERADRAEERATATQERAEEAHALAKAADARADRIENREVESRDVRWECEYSRDDKTLSVYNVGHDDAEEVRVRVDLRGKETGQVVADAPLVVGNRAQGVPIALTDWEDAAAARWQRSINAGFVAARGFGVSVSIKWRSPSGVPGAYVIEKFGCR